MSQYQLAARCDDSGSCESANRAVAECCTRGIARNISLMVPGPAFEGAVKLFRDLRNVSVGVHLTLNAEWDKVKWGPVLGAKKVPALVEPDGMFTQNPMMLHERKAPIEQLLDEAKAQLAKARASGLKIDYLDDHMGVSWVSGLAAELAELCKKEGLIWGSGIPFKFLQMPKTGSLTEQMIQAVGDASEPGNYLHVTHPGYDDDQFRAFGIGGSTQPGQIARERAEDTRMYCDPGVAKAIKDKGIKLVRYVDL
jgi:chitin disaccharide deacetylase